MVAAQQQKTGAFNVLVGKIDDVLQYAIGDPMRYLANWGRLYSLWPVHLETACCVPPETTILGDNKAIAEYDVGDTVTGAKGLVGVTDTFNREFNGNLIQIRGRGMLPLSVTPEHPILTVQRKLSGGKGTYSKSPVWKPAGEMTQSPPVKVNGRFTYPSGSHDCLLVPRIKGTVDLKGIDLSPYSKSRGLNIVRGRGESPPLEFPVTGETAWMLGLYVAEGWSTENHEVCFALGHGEDALARKVASISRSLGYHPFVKVRPTTTVVRFSSSILARAIRVWCGHLAEHKRIPDFVLYHKDPQILRAFIRGYFEGDGNRTVDPRGPVHLRAVTTSKVLAMQLQLAFARLGQFAHIKEGHRGGESKILGRAVTTHDTYDIAVMASERKIRDFDLQEDFIAVPIRRASEVPYSGEVRNLATADNTYLVSNAVVHNCSVEVGAAAGSRFDIERFGTLEAFGSLRACDLIIVMGTVTRKLAPRLKLIYDQMAEPKWVIAMGACSITGGLYFDSYNVLRGIDDIIPVDVYVPGCPPRAEALIQGLVLLQEKIRKMPTLSGR